MNLNLDDMMERMGGAKKFQYEIIHPGDEGIKTRFADVGGQIEAKVELMEIVDFLKNRQRYTDMGAKIPSGALLSGPPGNGKTLLARAIAGEASVPFINTAGTNFIEKIGGLGPKRVRDIFKECKELAPCILFIDEIDSIASKRSGAQSAAGNPGGRGSEEANNTLNQLLVEMDGLNSRDEIFVIGATNRDESLDPAVTRPGRLDRKVYIDDPTEIEREEVFRIHMAVIKLDPEVKEAYAARLAACTPGFSGAKIASVCNEAAINAARFSGDSVKPKDFEIAMERMTAGLERLTSSVTKEEVRLSAYYISAQALLSWALPNLTPVLKMSIAARVNNPLGFKQFSPSRNLLYTKEALLDLICRGLAGRASQLLFFDENTTQAQNDLKSISDIAYKMVADHGMGKSAPNLSFQEVRSTERRVNLWSDKLQQEMDQEVKDIVQEQYEKAHSFLQNNKELAKVLAEELYARKTLNEEDVQQIIDTHGPVVGSWTDDVSSESSN